MPRRQARLPGGCAGGPRSEGSFHASVRPRTPLRARLGNKARRRCSPGPRAAGPHAAPSGAAPPGMRASGPRSEGSFHTSVRPGAPVRARPGNKARRRCSPGPRAAGPHAAPSGAAPPGMRASGPRSEGSFHTSVRPGAPVRARPGNKARRRCSPGPRAAGPHAAPSGAAPPGMRASGPRSQGSFHTSVRPRTPVRAGPGNKARRRRPRSQGSFHASVQPGAPLPGRAGDNGSLTALAAVQHAIYGGVHTDFERVRSPSNKSGMGPLRCAVC